MIETNVNFLIQPAEVNFKFNHDLFDLLHSLVKNSSINFGGLIVDESGKYDCSLDSKIKIYFLKQIFDEPIYRLELLTIINIFINIDHRIKYSLSQNYQNRINVYNDICKEYFDVANSFKSPNLKDKFHKVFFNYLQDGLTRIIDHVNMTIISNIYSDLLSKSENIEQGRMHTNISNENGNPDSEIATKTKVIDKLKIKLTKRMTHNSFQYINISNDNGRLTKLMKFLINKEFIDENTSSSDFKSVFSDVVIKKKIIWTGSISELSYFIKYLHNTAKKVKDTKQKHWDITIMCFRMSNEKQLTKTNLRWQQLPETINSIETAVNLL